ncbi:DNA (cytosine-5-)-methyltransferase, partial [Ruminococcus sp.]|uniref:DNA (cytosine-5-)-methyltransferase n=1 Tax=Ruminococcus sp. TaxID=41978 RepID=UPI0025F23A1D
EKVGDFQCVGYCEIDKYAKQAYETMYDTEGEVYYNDARKIKPEELPDFDLICGGFPCQSFSIAGKRKGFKDDTRGTLFFEIARIAAVKKPKYLLLENVPGLLSHDSGRTFAAILSALDELGYDVTWQVINSADHNVAQSRKRVFIIGFLRSKCSGKILSFTEANPKTLAQRIPGREGCRVYSTDGLSITLTGSAGGFGGKTGLYEILGLPIKVKTKSGYQVALPGDSIDLAYPNINSRRGRVGHDIAHTVTPGNTQGSYQMYCIDMNPAPDITELARCITARQDNGITYHKGEHSAALMVADAPIPVLTPAKDKIRQQGRRFKNPDEPAFTITVTDRNGVVYGGLIRKLLPLECWRLQGFTDEQFSKVQNTGMSDAQLYKQAGNAVTVNVIAALAEFIKEIDEEMKNA